jgi:hypothetical protein
MPFSFPSSPTVGQQSTQNGRVYQWTGSAWEIVPIPTTVDAGNLTGTVAVARLPVVLEQTATVGNSGTSTTLALTTGSVQTVTLNGKTYGPGDAVDGAVSGEVVDRGAATQPPQSPANTEVSSPSPADPTDARIGELLERLQSGAPMTPQERTALRNELAQLSGDPDYEAPTAETAPSDQVGDPAPNEIGGVAGTPNNDATLRPVDQGLAGVVAPNGVETAAQSRNVDGGADQVSGSRMAQPADVMAAAILRQHRHTAAYVSIRQHT